MLAQPILLLFALGAAVQAHSTHDQQPIDPNADWATTHMKSEHHIDSWDAGSFFNLHDYNSNNAWSRSDIAKTLGLLDASTSHLTPTAKDAAVTKVLELFDQDRSGTVSFAEFTIGSAKGIKIPDFGYGPGHHGDDEYEYEIHHFEKYHDENTQEEDLNHPEDIEHFRKHDMLEEQAERQEQMDKMSVVEANIPGSLAMDESYDFTLEERWYRRHWSWLVLAIISRVAFWGLADQHVGDVNTQVLCWIAIFAAVYVLQMMKKSVG
ncbi:hypothetical protein B0A48_13994 [Cryoendolithus antarcticus]|uniref:EF-hand domain-containing protein n=1 Tax=Cryoendolithus antarcticus TaxID=1507870 RepID=A0A1V8SM13_9PEZI|nr:hypothetical protein B0A48_13994 [Cryoendolithus antarcticus]